MPITLKGSYRGWFDEVLRILEERGIDTDYHYYAYPDRWRDWFATGFSPPEAVEDLLDRFYGKFKYRVTFPQHEDEQDFMSGMVIRNMAEHHLMYVDGRFTGEFYSSNLRQENGRGWGTYTNNLEVIKEIERYLTQVLDWGKNEVHEWRGGFTDKVLGPRYIIEEGSFWHPLD